jgi:RNA polymerase sigma-70 factor (ECF subfamily)
MCDHEPAEIEAKTSPAVARVLVENHRHFLGFLQKRVGDRALAEDILQDAFAKGLDGLDSLRAEESAVAWFYRILRNAIIDHRRRDGTKTRALDSFAAEVEQHVEPDVEVKNVICRCVGELATTLKPEYAEALKHVEVEGLAVKDFAERAGISSNNAAVRVFRAREALRKQVARSCGTCAEHGCLDCTCKTLGRC